MKLDKQSVKNIIKVIVFLTIMFRIFLFCTYLFRNTDRITRQVIVEYYEEEKESLDVVFVGASNVYAYWDPLRAYEKYGFASRNYSVSAMNEGTYLAAIKEIEKTQTPQLVVVEARLFGREHDMGQVMEGARNMLDSMDWNFSRLKAVNYYCEKTDISWEDSIPLYLDLMLYHDKYEALLNPLNWELADNRLGENVKQETVYKGYCGLWSSRLFEEPSKNFTEEYAELDENAVKLYTDIIEYCQENNIPLLITINPVVILEEESATFNTLAEIADSYGVPFLDTNFMYEEIGLDFSKDFYDEHHVNVLGADKFTDYLGGYLVENYKLPDHRGESEYIMWDELYEEYSPKMEYIRSEIQRSYMSREQAFEVEIAMQGTNDLTEWLTLADNKEITVFLFSDHWIGTELETESEFVLKAYGVTEKLLTSPEGFLVVYNNEVICSNSGYAQHGGVMGYPEVTYNVIVGESPSICIGNAEYYNKTVRGIQMVAFDNNTNEVFDSVVACISESGELLLERVEF